MHCLQEVRAERDENGANGDSQVGLAYFGRVSTWTDSRISSVSTILQLYFEQCTDCQTHIGYILSFRAIIAIPL